MNFASALAVHGINVNGVRPGWILTGGETQFMSAEAIEEGETRPLASGFPRWAALLTPMARCIAASVALPFGKPRDRII